MSCNSVVMIIDDSEADQFLSKKIIIKHHPDIVIIHADDGQEALEILEEADRMPEVIFLDINMPRMNGHEFLAAYHEKYNGDTSTIVIMLTSSDQDRDKERSHAFRCVKGYCIKPLEELDLNRYLTHAKSLVD